MAALPDGLVKKRNQYEPAFILLVGDFLRVCEFIEPTDAHLQVYSHRLYEILLRACTEFESLCREILMTRKPEPVSMTPFEQGAPESKGLSWYRGYNAAKHNRNAEFPQANLVNVLTALSAVFIILARLDFLESLNSRFVAPGGMWQGTARYRDVPFALQYEFYPTDVKT
jgi:hypothetical protein